MPIDKSMSREEAVQRIAELTETTSNLREVLSNSSVQTIEDLRAVTEEKLAGTEAEIEELKAFFPEEVDEPARAKQANEIIKAKGLNIEYVGDGLLFKRKSVGALVNSSVEDKEKAAPKKRKRSMEDYRPTEEEMAAINALSNVDMRPNECYVFEGMSADTNVDLDFEHFDEVALEDMAGMTPDNPQQLDHDRTIRSTIGKLISGRVANKKLYQKWYILDTPENANLIKNIAAGIFNKTSVSFGTELKDFKCDSCKQPVVSEACPHRPGMLDEKTGKPVTITIGRVAKFYENSLVWLPAQPKAGIRRNDPPANDAMPKSAKENERLTDAIRETVEGLAKVQGIDTSGKTVDEVIADLQAIQSIPTSEDVSDPNTLDTIPNEKSNSGEIPVTENQEQAVEAVTEAAEEAKVEEVVAEQATEAATEAAAEELKEEAAEEGNAEEAKSLDAVKAELAEIRKENQDLSAAIASLVEMAKANNEALEELKAKASDNQISREEIVQQVIASLPAAPAAKAAPKTLSGSIVDALNRSNQA